MASGGASVSPMISTVSQNRCLVAVSFWIPKVKISFSESKTSDPDWAFSVWIGLSEEVQK